MKLVLDNHVFDRLEADTKSADLLGWLAVQGKITVLMPRAFRDRLSTRSSEMLKCLPIHDISDVNSEADVLVSDDPSCRKRAQLSERFEALTYDEFVELLKLLQLESEAAP